jgi:hypothetical protein
MDCNTLINIIEEAGYTAYSYSGRNMYGDSCVGFTVDGDTGIFRAIADLIDAVDFSGTADPVFSDLYTLTGILRTAATDSMGLSTVVYFPHVKWEGE